MSENNFDLITREVYKLKERREHLEDENRNLRQQLTDLRSGRGIFVEIEGKRFALTMPSASLASSTIQNVPLNTREDIASPTSASLPTLPAHSTHPTHPIISAQSLLPASDEEKQQELATAQVEQIEEDIELQKTQAIQEVPDKMQGLQEDSTKELPASPTTNPHPVIELTEEDIVPTFLEEAMIDEFTSAATSPLAVWSGPPAPSHATQRPTPSEPKSQEEIDEEEKAALRHQLIGSFLLE